MRTLRRASLRDLLRHPWQSGLCIAGIAVGVGVVLAIDLAIQSAETAFELSSRAVSGKATHRIVGGPSGVPEEVWRRLRVEVGLRAAAPMVTADVTLEEPAAGNFRLVGIDPYAEAPLRNLADTGSGPGIPMRPFLTRPGTVVAFADGAREAGLEAGRAIRLRAGGRLRRAEVLQVLESQDPAMGRALARVLLCDVATAQELLGTVGSLDHVDLILDEDQRERVEALLPPGLELVPADARARSLGRMTEAFRLNLSFLSLLALVVGGFLIYNTMTFGVVRRRPLLGRLRALGITRGELSRRILAEALVLGVLGTLAGILLGTLLARGLVRGVSQTISDLYYAVSVSRVALTPGLAAKAGLLGLGATLAMAWWPSREAMRASPRVSGLRSSVEVEHRRRRPLAVAAGLATAGLGLLLVLAPIEGLAVLHVALFALVLGFALLAPTLTAALMALLRPLAGRLFGRRGTMAVRGVTATLGRTGVAVGALAVALSMTLGIAVMIRSFRDTVTTWLDDALRASIYVTVPGITLRQQTREVRIDPRCIEALAAHRDVTRLTTNRSVDVGTPEGPVRLVVLGTGDDRALEGYRLRSGAPERVWPSWHAEDAVLVSEPLATHRGLGVGDRLLLRTAQGARPFPIVGVFFDYASDQGLVLMNRRTYDRHWEDRGVTALALETRPGVDPDRALPGLRRAVEPLQDLELRTSADLREGSLEVFDRTFAITGVLRLLAAVVAFIGVLSALMALQFDRARELAMLRAHGMTRRELWGQVTAQTALLGLSAGLLALPLGAAFAVILTGEVNRRSFGWSLPTEFAPGLLLQTLLLALAAALLAGVAPAWSMSRVSPARALRNE